MSQMSEILSIWRSPLDKAALVQAQALADSQPRCSIGYGTDFSQMTIYNFGYYVGTASSYEDALSQMLAAMGSPGSVFQAGGLAFIPQQNFPVTPSSSYPFPFRIPDDSVIVGSGGGGIPGAGSTPFYHFSVTPSSSATVFLYATGSHNSGGVYFRSLAFQWVGPGNDGDVCIHADVWSAQVIRCTFVDCPTAVNASALSTGLEQCTINYTVASPGNQRAVRLSGVECLVLGPGVFSQTSPTYGGAANCTAISVEGVEHVVISDMQLYEWTNGVDFSHSATTNQILAAEITNCEILSWATALNVQVSGPGYTIAGLKVTSCTLAKTSESGDPNPIVIISAGSNTEMLGNLHDVTLLDCTVFNKASTATSSQCGLSIGSGSDIKVIGGTYSNNGQQGGAGIEITGLATDVQIIGANLQPSYPGTPQLNNQNYALMLVAGSNPSGILVSGCDMSGYEPSSPVFVDVSVNPTDFFIVNCLGYNDQNTPLAATPLQLLSGVSASRGSPRYFGPSVFSYFNHTAISLTVFGVTITASTGIIFLPSPYDVFSFDTVPTSYVWTGQ